MLPFPLKRAQLKKLISTRIEIDKVVYIVSGVELLALGDEVPMFMFGLGLKKKDEDTV